MKKEVVSMAVIRRIPRYFRYLKILLNEGVERVSSKELSETLGFTASQVRQDLNCFGEFGQQGYGYSVKFLYQAIAKILGVNSSHKAILVGAGNLGKAILSYMDFSEKGFSLIGVFDKDIELIGKKINNYSVFHINELDNFCQKHNPEVALLCAPSEAIAELAPILIDLRIKAFWNFSHYDISHNYPNVCVENVHLSDSLITLCYQLNVKKKSRSSKKLEL